MALVSGASGAGPFRLNPAGAQGAVTVKEDGSLKQTVPAAWARWITDGTPKKTPSRSSGTSDNTNFLFITFVHL
jgi:hypothetical protein